MSQNLRPSVLNDLGLLLTLEELTADLNRQAGLQAEFHVLGEKRRLSSEVELTLFRTWGAEGAVEQEEVWKALVGV